MADTVSYHEVVKAMLERGLGAAEAYRLAHNRNVLTALGIVNLAVDYSENARQGRSVFVPFGVQAIPGRKYDADAGYGAGTRIQYGDFEIKFEADDEKVAFDDAVDQKFTTFDRINPVFEGMLGDWLRDTELYACNKMLGTLKNVDGSTDTLSMGVMAGGTGAQIDELVAEASIRGQELGMIDPVLLLAPREFVKYAREVGKVTQNTGVYTGEIVNAHGLKIVSYNNLALAAAPVVNEDITLSNLTLDADTAQYRTALVDAARGPARGVLSLIEAKHFPAETNQTRSGSTLQSRLIFGGRGVGDAIVKLTIDRGMGLVS